MSFKIELTNEPSQRALSIRTRTSVEALPEEIGKAYNVIMQYLKEIGHEPSGVPFVAYYNLDMKDLDVEMGFPVSSAIAEKGNIKLSEIPGGKQISCMFKGPYKDMEAPYNEMTKWVKENEYTATGVAYEFYYNSPMDVPESELLTKIVFPLK